MTEYVPFRRHGALVEARGDAVRVDGTFDVSGGGSARHGATPYKSSGGATTAS
jgi:hypothetical protein